MMTYCVADTIPVNYTQMDQILAKAENNIEEEDEDAPDTWSLMGDKGFQGAQHRMKIVLPHKKPRNRQLTPAQNRVNNNIAGVRVIVENFYGRMVQKFRIMDIRYAYDKQVYPLLFQLCVSLTNFDLNVNPLRRN